MKLPTTNQVGDLAVAVGAVLIGGGVYAIYPPAAIILIGLGLIGLGYKAAVK